MKRKAPDIDILISFTCINWNNTKEVIYFLIAVFANQKIYPKFNYENETFSGVTGL